MKRYLLTIERTVALENMDQEDREYWGDAEAQTRTIMADDMEHALDMFHTIYPIAELDDFDIEAEEIV